MRTWIGIALVSVCGIASAQDLRQLLKDERYDDVRKLAQQRIAADAHDEHAYWFLSRAGLESSKNTAELERLGESLEPCLASIPQSALCHLALGETYGAIAATGGMLKGMRYVGRARDELEKAVALDPKNYTARSDLAQFYMQAPAIVGGGEDKAQQNLKTFESVRPEAAPLLRAEMHLQRGERDEATPLLLVADAFHGDDLADAHRETLSHLGFGLLQAKQAAKALAVFEFGCAHFADDAGLRLGLGRSELELGKTDAAVADLQQAVTLAPKLGAQYRLGLALQAKGENAQAIARLREYLALPAARENEDLAKDAKKRLQALEHPPG